MSDEYTATRKVVSPWKRGFKPPARTFLDSYNRVHHIVVCPGCAAIDLLTYTGENDKDGNHIYLCSACWNKVGSPTARAECDLMDVPLEKDTFWTACLSCPLREEIVGKGAGYGEGEICKHFRLEKWWPL